jgi:hypothetical protein
MICHALMKPMLVLAGALTIALGAFGYWLALRKEE